MLTSPIGRVRRRIAARRRRGKVDEVLRLARASFVQLQAAWDRADLAALDALAAEPLRSELREQLAQRGPGANHTEVLALHARLLALEDLHDARIASFEFSGLIRERVDQAALPFRELWMLASVQHAPWRLARVQSLS